MTTSVRARREMVPRGVTGVRDGSGKRGVVGVRAFGRWVVRHRGVLAVALLLGAVLFAGLSRVADGAERHSYNRGATPPDSVRLTAGHKYEVSVPGGRKALARRGIVTTSAQCSIVQDGGAGVP